MPSAGCAARVSVSAARCRSRAPSSKAAGGYSHGVVRAEFEVVAQFGEGDEQVGEHSGALTALTGKEEGDLALGRALGEMDAVRGIVLPGQRLPQPPGQFVHMRGHDRHPRRIRTDIGPAGRAQGQVAQPPRPTVGLGGPEQFLDGPECRRRVPAPEHEQFGGPFVQRLRRCRAVRVRAEHHMEVGAAEAERTDTGEPLRGRSRPGPGPGVEDERAALLVPGGVGVLQMQGGRPDAGVQRQGRLDQSGQPGGTLGVPYLRLDRTEHTAPRLGPCLAEHLAQDGQFGPVADHGPGAVRLDETDIGR